MCNDKKIEFRENFSKNRDVDKSEIPRKQDLKKMVYCTAIIAMPTIRYKWEEEPGYSNQEVRDILDDVRIGIEFLTEHELTYKTLFKAIKLEKSVDCERKVTMETELRKLLYNAITSACPELEAIWSRNPSKDNECLRDKLNELSVILQYIEQRPRFIKNIKNGLFK